MKDSTIKLRTKLLLYIGSILIIYTGLFILYFIIGNEFIFPSPNAIISRFFSILGDLESYVLISNTFLSLLVVILISFLIGGLFGIIAGVNKYIELLLKPIMRLFSTIPLIGLILIIMVLAGLKNTLYYAAVLILIPVFYNGFLTGVKTLNKELVDVYRLDSSLNLKVILKVYIPLISSNLRQALIDGLGLGIKVIVMCEFMCGVKNTLGGKLITLGNNFDYEGLYGYCLLLIIVVLIIEFIPTLVLKLYNYIKFQYNLKSNRI